MTARQRTDELAKGDIVHIYFPYPSNEKCVRGRVIRITPTGQAIVSYGKDYKIKFKPDGNAHGNNSWYAPYLVEAELGEKLAYQTVQTRRLEKVRKQVAEITSSIHESTSLDPQIWKDELIVMINHLQKMVDEL